MPTLSHLAQILHSSEQPHPSVEVRKTVLKLADEYGISHEELFRASDMIKRAELKKSYPELPREPEPGEAGYLPF